MAVPLELPADKAGGETTSNTRGLKIGKLELVADSATDQYLEVEPVTIRRAGVELNCALSVVGKVNRVPIAIFTICVGDDEKCVSDYEVHGARRHRCSTVG